MYLLYIYQFANVNNISKKRDELVAQQNVAKLEGNTALEEYYQELLEKLDEEARKRKRQEKKRLASGSILKKINEVHKEENYKVLQAHEENSKIEKAYDPSHRTETIPMNIWSVSTTDNSKEVFIILNQMELPDIDDKPAAPVPQHIFFN